MKPWSRRHFLASALAAAPCVKLRAVASSHASRFTDAAGAEYVPIPAGSFVLGETRPIPRTMGEPLAYMTRGELQAMFPHGNPDRFVLSDVLFEHGDPDERSRLVRIARPFHLAVTQVTNLEYERFDPAHRRLRGRFGFSTDDDEAVIYVSWLEAMAYCAWLSRREGRSFRLPTEAEWEYAARSGTSTLFAMGDTLPDVYLKNARVTDFTAPADKVSLVVGRTPPNAWGLYDMHGNVEEWVHDWYALGQASAVGGPSEGVFRVTRGGSHGTFAYYLRSANRMAALPETRGFTIGFRVACAEPLPVVPEPGPVRTRAISAPRVRPLPQASRDVFRGPDPAKPYFKGPLPFVKIPAGADGPLFAWHNHDTALTECPNGDLLAAWYTCAREQGRELSIAASRLPFGSEVWGEASSFYDTPDRNDHCPALWFDGEQTLYHLNGTALSHFWEPLQIVLRHSTDNGLSWSIPRYIAPDFGLRNMVCQPIVALRNGWWIFGADAHPDGSALWLSKDKGVTWECTPGTIHGIHAAIVELHDGRLMALGRGNNVNGQLPRSVSADFGKTWSVQATDLPPITYTQRFSMIRLVEGPLALITFLPDTEERGPGKKTDRELAKLSICLSFDEGETWPTRRVLSAESGDRGINSISGARVYLGPGTGEPAGYCSMKQARNGVLHVLSSSNHYALNLAWILADRGRLDPMPRPRSLVPKRNLAADAATWQADRISAAPGRWTNERTGAMNELVLSSGFTVEAMVVFASANVVHTLRAYVRSGCTVCNRYWLRMTPTGAEFWYAGQWRPLPADAGARDRATYRMSIRDDTCVQIFREARMLAAFPPSYEIGFAPPTRGSWIETESTGASDGSVFDISYDLGGAFEPA